MRPLIPGAAITTVIIINLRVTRLWAHTAGHATAANTDVHCEKKCEDLSACTGWASCSSFLLRSLSEAQSSSSYSPAAVAQARGDTEKAHLSRTRQPKGLTNLLFSAFTTESASKPLSRPSKILEKRPTGKGETPADKPSQFVDLSVTAAQCVVQATGWLPTTALLKPQSFFRVSKNAAQPSDSRSSVLT